MASRILPLSLESLNIIRVVHTNPNRLDEQIKALTIDKRFSALRFVRIGREDVEFPIEEVPDGWDMANEGLCVGLWKIPESDGDG